MSVGRVWGLLLIGLSLAGLGSTLMTTRTLASEATVKIENFTFNPAVLTIARGTTVTWDNADDIPHSIVENTGKFKSKALDTGDTFSMTFAEPGETAYFCGFHNHMTGKIVVTP